MGSKFLQMLNEFKNHTILKNENNQIVLVFKPVNCP